MKKYLYILAIATCSTAAWVEDANALMVINNVSYTSNSVSFAINGDMTGYATTPGQNYGFGIVYNGGIWNESPYTGNSWNTSVFDNLSINHQGNTGTWSGSHYSWSHYGQNLVTGVATNRNIVLTMGDNYLNTAATTGGFDIIWGHDLSQPTNVLYHYDVAAAPVPEPETYAMLLAGLGLLGFMTKRRKNNVA